MATGGIVLILTISDGSASHLLNGRASPEMESITIALHGLPNVGHCAYVTIGTPPSQEVLYSYSHWLAVYTYISRVVLIPQFCVLTDTGSANLAIAGAADREINSFYSPMKYM